MSTPEDLLGVDQILETSRLSDGFDPLPSHFAQVTLSKNGGVILRDETGQIVAECFPTFKNGCRGMVIREEVDGTNFLDQIRNLFPWVEFIQTFSPGQSFTGSESDQLDIVKVTDGFAIAHPNRLGAQKAVELQKLIWGTTSVYPADLYDQEGPAATRLVAVEQDRIIGFLLGFWGIKDSKLWLESQILGVHPDYRKRGVARVLKEQQRQEAFEQGVKVIRWTVDPLQRPNAYLNFNTLGAVATAFYPDYYGFTNQLNLVSASRFTMTYLTNPRTLSRLRDIFEVENQERLYVQAPDWQMTNTQSGSDLYIEIPEHWTELQKTSLAEAVAVRKKTDQLLTASIGCAEGKYVMGRIKEIAGRYFLVAKQYSRVAEMLEEDIS